MNRKHITIAVAALALIGSWLFIVRSATNTDTAGQWFYDLGTSKLFASPPGQVAPITAPGGGEGVEAMVYACGECTGQDAVGYLLKHEPALKKQLEAGEDVDPQALIAGRLIRAADGTEWFAEGSSQAREIKAALRAACAEKRVVACHP